MVRFPSTGAALVACRVVCAGALAAISLPSGCGTDRSSGVADGGLPAEDAAAGPDAASYRDAQSPPDTGPSGPDGSSGDGGAGDASISARQPSGTQFLDPPSLLGNVDDPSWFVENIPFLEVPDAQIQAVYYYRWQTYKEHLVYTGPQYGYLVGEFLWPSTYGAPYGGIVAAAGHHINEGKWLHTQQYVKDDIDYWLNGPGQFPKPQTDAVDSYTTDWAHEYSFWAASSVWQWYLVAGDRAFAVAHEPALVAQYSGWDSHFDATLGLYWQVPVWDATEYSPSSYESSDPYHGGAGFRPTLTGYQYGDAKAIAAIATLAGDTATATEYTSKAAALQTSMQSWLWDPTRSFFYDMPQSNNPTHVLLDTREEMGFVPWMFDMPQESDAVAFQQLLDPNGFASAYGPTTAERRSTWFMYQAGTGCCHWDGPSWPYETSQTLTGLANLLDDYPAQSVVSASDYVGSLHTYAGTQMRGGAPYVGQAHDPDNDDWIYAYGTGDDDYNHSTYIDNVISGLIGLRGQPDDTLVVKPLAPATWDYFALENVLYHGHWVTVLWDRTGSRYGQGAGLHVYIDGSQTAAQQDLTAVTVTVGPAIAASNRLDDIDVAANGQRFAQGPQPIASYTFANDNGWNPIAGMLFRTGIPEANRWTSYESPNETDSYGVNFQRSVTVDYVRLYPYDDGMGVRTPASFDLQYWSNGAWVTVPDQTRVPAQPAANARNEVFFPPITTSQLRVVAPNAGAGGDAGSGIGWGLGQFRVRSKPIFHIVNVNSGKLLAVQNASQSDGAQVQQYGDTGTADHLWELVNAGAGTFEIVNVNSGLLLAVQGASVADSALVEQTYDVGAKSSRWVLIDAGGTSAGGQFKIRNVNSGLLLGVDGESTADSANVVQFSDNGTLDHLWTIVPADDPQLFFDDFEDQSTAAWSPTSGAWSLCQPATYEYCAAPSGESVALTGDVAWRAYTVDALVRLDDPGPGASAGLVARARDSVHYYVAEIARRPDGTQGWDISRNDGGTVTALASGAFVWMSATSAQVALRFRVQGGYLSLGVVSGSGAVQTLGEVFDTTYPAGQAGLRAGAAEASFDRVRVRSG